MELCYIKAQREREDLINTFTRFVCLPVHLHKLIRTDCGTHGAGIHTILS